MTMDAAVKVLVVDDEQGIRDLLSFELKSRGYAVSTASDGAEAVERVRHERFAVVLTDVRMPRLGGLGLLEAVKRADPSVEIIMSTGHANVADAVAAMKMGAYDFIEKPFDVDELVVLVEKALEKGELKSLVGLYEASRAVFSTLEAAELMPLLARSAGQVLRADCAAIQVADASGELTPSAEWVLAGSACAGGPGGAAWRAAAADSARRRAPVVADQPAPGVRSALFFPLTLKGEFLGMLEAGRGGGSEPFGVADVRHCTILASQIAQAVQNARLYASVQERMLEIQRMQDRLVHAEKLSAVGRLAAGVAHEINNPLTAILGFADILGREEGLGAEQRADLGRIVEESRRCKGIVQDLMRFSRPTPSRKEPLDAASVVGKVLDLFRFELRRANIDVVRELPESLPPVQGDAAKLEQVFLNLVVNARDAMAPRGSGTLTVRAEAAGGLVRVSVADDGPGIEGDDLGRVFEPFFTTKPVGKGTGLGLSISYGIVGEHGGALTVSSSPGTGTVFVVELPACGPAPRTEGA
jgi:signal transduction histidine kinase/ActR/RegA family two-component response regulator